MPKNLLQIARDNLFSYEKRAAKKMIKVLNEKIKQNSFDGCFGTYISIKAFNENGECVTILKKYYEGQGFKVEIGKGYFWVWWMD